MAKSKVENGLEEPEKPTKFDKIKKFGKKYWLPITVGVVCTTVTYVVTRRVTLRHFQVLEGISIEFFNKPTHKLVEVTAPKAINGITGNAVFNPNTRVGYLSQQSAARAYGVSEPVLSSHLNGAIPHIKGEVLERANFRIFAEVAK